MKDFVVHGRCVILSVVQRIMHQVLLEKYGGPLWTPDDLPIIVRDWLTAEGYQRAKILTYANEKGVSLASAIQAEMGRRGGGNAGSLRREMTIQKALAGGLFPIRGVKTGGLAHLTINFLSLRITVPMRYVTEGLFKVDDQVNVDFPIFEARNEDCWARDALRTDPGYLVAVRLCGIDRNGKNWVRYLKAAGDDNAKKANNIYDWMTDT